VFFVLSKLINAVLLPSNFVMLLGVLGIFALILRWRRLGLSLMVLSALMTAVGGVSPLGSIVLSTLEDRFPIPQVSEPPAGIIVLGGTTNIHISSARGVTAFNEAGERLTETAALAHRFPTARVFLSGGIGHLIAPNTMMTESSITRDLLVRLAVPAERISMEQNSRTTYENAVESLKAIKPKPGEKWLLVTSASHMPRAIACFRAVGFDITPYPVDFRTRGPMDFGDIQRSVADSFELLDAAAHEWVGLITYRLAGQTNEIFPSP
jgi:uncharacterized SAM-binding protein YcdF (DUF218 family)